MARPKDIEKHFKGEGVKAYWTMYSETRKRIRKITP